MKQPSCGKVVYFYNLPAEIPIDLFDCDFNSINSTINLIIRQDKKEIFRFAVLQFEAVQKLADQHNLEKEGFDSFILIDNWKVYKRSTAALRIPNKLPYHWK